MGFKKSSELVSISDRVVESAANTFTEKEVSLPLDTLNREIFVVTDIILDADTPSTVAGTNATVSGSLCSTSQTGVQDINNSQCLSSVREQFLSITAEGQLSHTRLPAAYASTGTPRDYLGIIATPNFFVQIVGFQNTAAKALKFRVMGFRARADADTYSALVASEVLSA